MPDEAFALTLSVRDYECDMQGVVNNAVYQNYLEHARHEFLKTVGLDFATLTEQGVIVMVIRAEIDYLKSLRSGDEFLVTVVPRREGRLRLIFEQTIVHKQTGQTHVRAQIVTAAVNDKGRPYFPQQLLALLPASN